MATHKAKVIGQLEVNGVAPGGPVELDDELVNLDALVSARLVEVLPDPEPKPTTKGRKNAPKDGEV